MLALVIHAVQSGLFNLILLQFNRLSLFDTVHVWVLHVVDHVWGACRQDKDAFQNRDYQFCVQTCLQKSVHLGLLHQFLKLIELDLLVPPAGDLIPDVTNFGAHNFVPRARKSDEKTEYSN